MIAIPIKGQKAAKKLCSNKKASRLREAFFAVRAERLELSHLAALDPKSSVSTNSTTPALKLLQHLGLSVKASANIHIPYKSQRT